LHVQFVSKIGRVIGRCLKLNEDLIEAISLGHDLGHAPYGHDGEKILNDICEENKMGYFCHNAQSVRFLTEIEKKGEGLNLSLQVLDGILAHNGEMLSREYCPAGEKTWDKFEEEYRNCFKIKDYGKKIFPMTLEGCVVRISDVLAYIGRDIEDAITLKVIKRKDIPKKIERILGDRNDKIIDTLVLDLVKNSYGKKCLVFSKGIFEALSDLKQFNYNKIYEDKRVKAERHKINGMFRQLFGRYWCDLKDERRDSRIYRNFLKDMGSVYCQRADSKRKVIDFISGMTDDFFNDQYNELFVPQSYGYTLKPSRKKT
jgi:dGTPase